MTPRHMPQGSGESSWRRFFRLRPSSSPRRPRGERRPFAQFRVGGCPETASVFLLSRKNKMQKQKNGVPQKPCLFGGGFPPATATPRCRNFKGPWPLEVESESLIEGQQDVSMVFCAVQRLVVVSLRSLRCSLVWAPLLSRLHIRVACVVCFMAARQASPLCLWSCCS